MPNREPNDELLAAALRGVSVCPPLEELERLLTGEDARLNEHVRQCPHCQTELQMLRSFTSNEVAEHERAAVEAIAARLKPGATSVAAPWWTRIFTARWLSPAAAVLAVGLAAVGIGIELRHGTKPALDTEPGRTEVLRSSAIAILGPVGDLREKPAEIRWEPAANAARYQVRLMEVDRAELWSAETTQSQIDLPPQVESLIVPAKTLLIEVAAFDARGRKMAESETVRFRLLQNVFTH
jgi:hypothetical protein